MANNQKLNATITIGGALAASFKNVIGGATSQLSRVGQTIRQLNERQQRLQNLAGHWEKQGRDASRFRAELDRVNRSLQQQQRIRTNLNAQQQNQNQRGQFRGQLLDAVALGTALAAPIKTAAKFEQSMAQVGAVSRASAVDLDRLTKEARRLGATTNFTASEAAEGMQFLAMAGFSVDQNLAAMPGLLSLAAAGATDLGSASDIASNILSGFNMQAGEMGRLGDVLTNTFTSSNTNLQMLGETMAYVAPVAAATGLSLEDTAAAAGKLGDAGIQASQAGTALRAIISRLAAPTSEAAGMLQQLGIKTTDANGNLRRMPDILADLDKSMNGFGSAARAEITSTIFGLEAASAATVLLGKAGTGELQSYSEKLKEVGSASRVAEQQNQTATGSMRRLGSAVESIGITIGNVLLPTLADGATALASVVGVVDTLAQEFPLLTQVVVGVTAGLIGLKVASLAGGYAFTFIRGAWLSASLMGTRLIAVLPMIATGIKTIGLALAANPIGLVITGIALAAGFLIANWDSVSSFFQGLWQRVTGFFMENWDAIKGILSWTPLGFIVNAWEPVTQWFSGFWDGILDQAKVAIDWIGKKFEWIGGAASKVKSWFGFGDDSESSSATSKAGNDTLTDLPGGDSQFKLPPVEPARAGGVNVQKAGDSNTYNITVSGAGDPDAVAAKVMALIKAQEAERNRSALFDQGSAYAY